MITGAVNLLKHKYIPRAAGKLTGTCLTIGNGIYPYDNLYTLIEQAHIEYDWSDIQPTDVVLDIGAANGGFSIRAAKQCKKVIAIEPLLTGQLKSNIRLNRIKNIEIIPFGISDKRCSATLEFNEIRQEVLLKPLSEILSEIPDKITFLKCDCEGAEEFIPPGVLSGIRRIEIELHEITTNNKINSLYEFLKQNWNTSELWHDPNCVVLHCHRISKGDDR
jgi:FkbM family methyltransferase